MITATGNARPGPPCHQAARSCPGVDQLRVASRAAVPNEEIWLVATRFSTSPGALPNRVHRVAAR
jgi:hypothetical protein